MARLTYAKHFEGLVVQLEVTGRCIYTTESEFNSLKTAIESENRPGRPFYSLHKIDGVLCETCVVK